MWTRTIVVMCLLLVAATMAEEDNKQLEPRRGHLAYRVWTKMLYYALPYIIALKVKVVIVAVAATLLVLKFWGPFGFGAGPYSAYEAPPGQWSEYPGKESRQLSGFTERVMRGLETAELTWRATTDDENSGCAARLACEARKAAQSDSLAARMVAGLGSSLTELERSGRSEDCEILGCKLSLPSAIGYHRR